MYAYAAGHGLGGVRQYLLLNELSIDKALFDIEEELRMISEQGKGKCFVLAVYDLCRNDASKQKVLCDERVDQLYKARMAAKYPGRGEDYEKPIAKTQYFHVQGTSPGKALAAKSHLCVEFHGHLLHRSMCDIRQEVQFPRVCDDFKGYDGRVETTKVC